MTRGSNSGHSQPLQYFFIRKPEPEILNESHRMAPAVDPCARSSKIISKVIRVPLIEDQTPHGAIADVPIELISDWIDIDAELRSILIARAAPFTLDDDGGGALTRFLLQKYGNFENVRIEISAIFGSGDTAVPPAFTLAEGAKNSGNGWRQAMLLKWRNGSKWKSKIWIG